MKKACFIILFFSTLSCKNKIQTENKINLDKAYSFSNSKATDTLFLIHIDALTYSFKFKHNDLLNRNRSFSASGLAKNIDPDGNAAFEEFDPASNGDPTELYVLNDKEFKYSIAVPLTTSALVDFKISQSSGNKQIRDKYQVTLSK